MARILAVIVSYRPDPGRLRALAERVRPQVDHLLVVDNGSPQSPQEALAGLDVEVVALPGNLGIGAALNRGIDRARTDGFSHVLTLDQDSLPAPDMVATLLRAEQDLLAAGHPVAVVGPRHRDPRSGTQLPFIRGVGPFQRRLCPPGDAPPMAVSHLITSGALVRTAVFDRVGAMREDFFIDYVDIEWCLRAGRMGLASWAVPAASMEHTIGDSTFGLLGRRISVHSPLRNYTICRNALLMCRLPHVPVAWKADILVRLARRIVVHGALIPGRGPRLRMMLLGLAHGLAGQAGALPAPPPSGPAPGPGSAAGS